jgi:hypothetical protein
MVENLRKAEFDAAQPVRNQETGKVDYIVRVADHKTAEAAPVSCLAFLETPLIIIER